MNALIKIALVLGVVVALYFYDPENGEEDLKGRVAADNVVVMYSLTTCPYCKKTRDWLTKNDIPFAEYFLDTDEARNREFSELLMSGSVPSGAVGTPSLVVNEMLLLNNPPFDVIRTQLRLRDG